MAVAPPLTGGGLSTTVASALSSKFFISRTTYWLALDIPAKSPKASERRLRAAPVAALGGLLGGIFGGGTDIGESTRQLYANTGALINQIESEISSLSDSHLRDRTSALQQCAVRGDSLDSLLPENSKLAEDAVQLAIKTWGQKSLTELEAEERLSYSCEKGPVEDEVISKLHHAFLEINKEYKVYTEEERKKVVSAGGLHVVGTERHESRLIGNHLRGRSGSGRQGDPGSSRFFLSLEDNIFRIFGGDRIQGLTQLLELKTYRLNPRC